MSNSLWGFTGASPLDQVVFKQPHFNDEEPLARIVYLGQGQKFKKSYLDDLAAQWQLSNKSAMIEKLTGKAGPIWLVRAEKLQRKNHGGQFDISSFTMARDTMGGVYRDFQKYKNIHFSYVGKDIEEFKGCIVGMELSQYRFRNYFDGKNIEKCKFYVEASQVKETKKVFDAALAIGKATNLARHLVNLPPNELNPKTYSEFLKKLFQKLPVKVEIWDYEKLKKENMGLHCAVGQASHTPPYLVKLSYRANKLKKHYAFVGKGITFDSGGLDIKPASGMRDMKKDMGGSASVAGLCYWMALNKPKVNADFYLPLAENSVSSNSFRPGDIIRGRNGKTVEIHNTDAEGRLVLADSLALAAEQKPEAIINVATLTGAIKVGLGANLPGLFCNTDSLAKNISKSAQLRGDNCWRMPLDPGQKSRLKSNVADLVNCTDGFGGAVTAALFLEHYVQDISWAHIDIYAWTTSASGALSEKGGSGQMVQALSHFIESI